MTENEIAKIIVDAAFQIHKRLGPWVKELVWQNMKDVVKKYFYAGTFFTSLSQCFLLTLNNGNDTVQLTIHLF